MKIRRLLRDSLIDAPMRHYFRRKFHDLPSEELELRIEETLRFLFISHECAGPIPVSREIDEIWHAWILQTQEYFNLCDRLPTGRYIHHSSNDYLIYFDPTVDERDSLELNVKMLALYAVNFGPFEESRAKYWLLAHHLLEHGGWSIDMLNDWLIADQHHEEAVADAPVSARSPHSFLSQAHV